MTDNFHEGNTFFFKGNFNDFGNESYKEYQPSPFNFMGLSEMYNSVAQTITGTGQTVLQQIGVLVKTIPTISELLEKANSECNPINDSGPRSKRKAIGEDQPNEKAIFEETTENGRTTWTRKNKKVDEALKLVDTMTRSAGGVYDFAAQVESKWEEREILFKKAVELQNENTKSIIETKKIIQSENSNLKEYIKKNIFDSTQFFEEIKNVFDKINSTQISKEDFQTALLQITQKIDDIKNNFDKNIQLKDKKILNLNQQISLLEGENERLNDGIVFQQNLRLIDQKQGEEIIKLSKMYEENNKQFLINFKKENENYFTIIQKGLQDYQASETMEYKKKIENLTDSNYQLQINIRDINVQFKTYQSEKQQEIDSLNEILNQGKVSSVTQAVTGVSSNQLELVNNRLAMALRKLDNFQNQANISETRISLLQRQNYQNNQKLENAIEILNVERAKIEEQSHFVALNFQQTNNIFNPNGGFIANLNQYILNFNNWETQLVEREAQLTKREQTQLSTSAATQAMDQVESSEVLSPVVISGNIPEESWNIISKAFVDKLQNQGLQIQVPNFELNEITKEQIKADLNQKLVNYTKTIQLGSVAAAAAAAAGGGGGGAGGSGGGGAGAGDKQIQNSEDLTAITQAITQLTQSANEAFQSLNRTSTQAQTTLTALDTKIKGIPEQQDIKTVIAQALVNDKAQRLEDRRGEQTHNKGPATAAGDNRDNENGRRQTSSGCNAPSIEEIKKAIDEKLEETNNVMETILSSQGKILDNITGTTTFSSGSTQGGKCKMNSQMTQNISDIKNLIDSRCKTDSVVTSGIPEIKALIETISTNISTNTLNLSFIKDTGVQQILQLLTNLKENTLPQINQKLETNTQNIVAYNSRLETYNSTNSEYFRKLETQTQTYNLRLDGIKDGLSKVEKCCEYKISSNDLNLFNQNVRELKSIADRNPNLNNAVFQPASADLSNIQAIISTNNEKLGQLTSTITDKTNDINTLIRAEGVKIAEVTRIATEIKTSTETNTKNIEEIKRNVDLIIIDTNKIDNLNNLIDSNLKSINASIEPINNNINSSKTDIIAKIDTLDTKTLAENTKLKEEKEAQDKECTEEKNKCETDILKLNHQSELDKTTATAAAAAATGTISTGTLAIPDEGKLTEIVIKALQTDRLQQYDATLKQRQQELTETFDPALAQKIRVQQAQPMEVVEVSTNPTYDAIPRKNLQDTPLYTATHRVPIYIPIHRKYETERDQQIRARMNYLEQANKELRGMDKLNTLKAQARGIRTNLIGDKHRHKEEKGCETTMRSTVCDIAKNKVRGHRYRDCDLSSEMALSMTVFQNTPNLSLSELSTKDGSLMAIQKAIVYGIVNNSMPYFIKMQNMISIELARIFEETSKSLDRQIKVFKGLERLDMSKEHSSLKKIREALKKIDPRINSEAMKELDNYETKLAAEESVKLVKKTRDDERYQITNEQFKEIKSTLGTNQKELAEVKTMVFGMR